MILVAGGTGRLGRLVVDQLLARGERVRVLTRDRSRMRSFASGRIEVVEGDVRIARDTSAAARGATLVVSAVQGFAGPGNVTPASVDRDGNYNLVEAATAAGAAFVMVSVVGADAASPMELFRMKSLAEARVRSSGLPWTIVRATAFIELWIALLTETAGASQRPLVFGRGENLINFVSVRDVASFVTSVTCDPNARGRTFELGGPENLTLNALARLVARNIGRPGEPRHVPRAALHLMAHTLGRLRPAFGRQVEAALAMDALPLEFDSVAARAQYPTIPSTTAAYLLGAGQTGT